VDGVAEQIAKWCRRRLGSADYRWIGERCLPETITFSWGKQTHVKIPCCVRTVAVLAAQWWPTRQVLRVTGSVETPSYEKLVL
jgi:hypothetical protein